MTRLAIALLALVGATVAAETTVINVFLAIADKQPLVGSVIAADASITTFAVACPSERAHLSDCDFPVTQTVTEGLSTFAATLDTTDSDGPSIQTFACEVDRAKDMFDCTYSVIVSDTASSTFTAVIQSTGLKDLLIPVTITAGVEKLAAATATATTAGRAKESSSGSKGSTPTNSGNAGAMVTQNALLAGAAALVGGIVAL